MTQNGPAGVDSWAVGCACGHRGATGPVLVDVTDLVEFLQRKESVSGVQRVIAETAPLILAADPAAAVIILDRPRGVFVPLTPVETDVLVRRGVTAGAGRSTVTSWPRRRQAPSPARGRRRPWSSIRACVVVFLGAVWINDALMLAARDAHAAGARCVYLLYDLTPVLETGHTAAVNKLFDRYLALVAQTASRGAGHLALEPDGLRGLLPRSRVGCPGGRGHRAAVRDHPRAVRHGATSPWPRPYALFVGTVESRKNHLLALRAWARLIDAARTRRGAGPRLRGRLGWHADAFLDEYVRTRGLDGKVSVLSSSISDAELARFYAHAEFTVYPSRYEGWGLPVSESLAFGKLPVVAYNSSLPEAGGDLAAYFASDDLDDFVAVLRARALDLDARGRAEERIRG